MRTFTLIWLGQLVSTLGSYMTGFALLVWAWELTGSATALALVGFFFQLPRIPITFLSGFLVDRLNRKHLMILGDAIAALSTLAIGLLYLTGHLHIWHLYLFTAINGGFGQIQQLAYSTSIALMVPPQHYTRANSMNSAVHYGSTILAPALAGTTYPIIGLHGILLIDLITFGLAIALLLATPVPQPQPQTDSAPICHTLTFGFRYVWQHPSLKALLLITALFWFVHDFGSALYDPMILARSQGSTQVLGGVASAAGVGGVTGAILLSVYSRPKRRIHGLLVGFIGAGVSKTIFGLGRSPTIWIPAQFCSSLHFPLLGSSETALWMERISPEMQGRVFAANALVVQVMSAIAALIAGPLSDRVFEPFLQSNNPLSNLIASIMGEPGAGIATLYLLSSIGLIGIGLSGYTSKSLKSLQEMELAKKM
ncbi:MFS transporter [Leptolyngbya sp. PL-A3]|uniref:MFS transporter n=1 Tax=Leptolyngbya sp. PL-A3 TaxID=2933911 RepID=UPI00329696E9